MDLYVWIQTEAIKAGAPAGCLWRSYLKRIEKHLHSDSMVSCGRAGQFLIVDSKDYTWSSRPLKADFLYMNTAVSIMAANGSMSFCN